MKDTFSKLVKTHPELEIALHMLQAESVDWLLQRQTHVCPMCEKLLQMNDLSWRNHMELHVRITELEDV